MDDSELLRILTHEEQNAYGELTGDLADQRSEAMKFYLGQPFGDEIEGRSQVVSSDVYDAVEGMLPSLLEIFTGSEKAVEFSPQGMEDVQSAKQATEACNYVFYRQNNGFLILYTWFKDALIQKNGIVKFYYEDKEDRRKESYKGLTDQQLAQLVQDPSVEVLSHEAYPDPQPQQMAMEGGGMQIPMLHDVEILYVNKYGKVCVENVPPEEFKIAKRHTSVSLQNCPFCSHDRAMTRSDLKAMGYEVSEEDMGEEEDPKYNHPEAIARGLVTNDNSFDLDDSPDPAMRKAMVKESYVRVDYDGDGVAELRRILRVNKKILENEETDYIPFAAVTPNIIPHEFFGLSVYDTVGDVQYYKSSILRAMQDSLFLAIMPRLKVQSTPSGVPKANLDDLLTARPGGLVREYEPNAVNPLEMRFVGQQAFPMVEYWDSVKENRLGVTRYNQGVDADSLNKTAHGISAIMSAGQQKIRLVARIFAETGVKDLFKGIQHCLSKYSSKPMIMRLTNGFVPVDPRQWKTQWDMTVNVGLGTGDKQVQLQQLGAVFAQQMQFLQMGKGHMVSDKNLYSTAGEMVENAGLKHVESYFTDPTKVPPPQPPPPPPEIIKIQADAQIRGAELQQAAQSEERTRNTDLQKEALRAEVEKFVSELKSNTDIAIARMEIEAKERIKALEIRANADLAIFNAHQKALNGQQVQE